MKITTKTDKPFIVVAGENLDELFSLITSYVEDNSRTDIKFDYVNVITEDDN